MELQDWASLPELLISEVVAVLSARAKRDVRLVCAHWRLCVDHQVDVLVPTNAVLFGKAIRKFSGLRSLDLTRCQQQVSDKLLLALASKLRVHCPALKEISLQNCHLVTSHGVEAVVAQMPQLTSLSLYGCRQPFPVSSGANVWGYQGVDGRGLHHLTRLQHLDLSWSTVDDTCLPHLLPLPALRSLHLHNCHISDAGVEHLSGMPHLTSLGLGGASIHAPGLQALGRLPRLKSLDLRSCNQLLPDDLRALTATSTLRTLSLAHCCTPPAPPGALLPVALLPSLHTLDLSSCSGLSPHHLAAFHGHPSLTHLSLQSCRWVDDSALRELSNAPRLEVLLLSNCCRITHEGLRLLAASLKLRELDLSLTLGGEQMLHAVAAMPQLVRLDISYCLQVSKEGLGKLAAVGQLRELRMKGCSSISDGEVAALRPLGSCLQLLDLAGCNAVTDAGLHTLSAGMRRLRALDLSYCWHLTDTGVARLSALPHLSSLTFEGCCHVSKASLTPLRHVHCHPNLLQPPHPPPAHSPYRPTPKPQPAVAPVITNRLLPHPPVLPAAGA